MVKLTLEENKLYRKYQSPHAGNLNSVKVNAIFINRNEKGGYTKKHESMKFELAWEAKGMGQNYIIEAERKATDEEIVMFKLKSGKTTIDFVNLTQEQESQIIHKHENHKQIKFYRDNGTLAIIVGEKFKCLVCKQFYPIKIKRHKKGICDNCMEEK